MNAMTHDSFLNHKAMAQSVQTVARTGARRMSGAARLSVLLGGALAPWAVIAYAIHRLVG